MIGSYITWLCTKVDLFVKVFLSIKRGEVEITVNNLSSRAKLTCVIVSPCCGIQNYNNNKTQNGEWELNIYFVSVTM